MALRIRKTAPSPAHLEQFTVAINALARRLARSGAHAHADVTEDCERVPSVLEDGSNAIDVANTLRAVVEAHCADDLAHVRAARVPQMPPVARDLSSVLALANALAEMLRDHTARERTHYRPVSVVEVVTFDAEDRASLVERLDELRALVLDHVRAAPEESVMCRLVEM